MIFPLKNSSSEQTNPSFSESKTTVDCKSKCYLLTQKINPKHLRYLNKEVAPEPILRAPPPTPCMTLKQRSGSVPDVRVVDMRKEKLCGNIPYHRSAVQAFTCKPGQKSVIDFDGKRSTSEHIMASGYLKGPWMVLGMSPCTSNLLHSVRQRLLNL